MCRARDIDPLLLAGNLGNDAASRDSFTDDGFFHTCDLATIDAEGNVVITRRVKHLINRGGIKINPTDIENLITAYPAVVHAAMVAMADDVLGEVGRKMRCDPRP